MSVICVSLTNNVSDKRDWRGSIRTALEIYDKSVKAEEPEPYMVAFSVVDEIGYRRRNGLLALPENIASTLQQPGGKLGRTGVRDIVSPWAKKNYPEATREVVVTLIDINCGTHTLIAYL